MKNYPREYERVFTGRELLKRKCDLDLVTIDGNYIKSASEYANLFSGVFVEIRKHLFNFLVKYVWLSRRFCYGGVRRTRNNSNGYRADISFATFLRNYANLDTRLFFGTVTNRCLSKVISYMDDFFPDFDVSNPFVDSYEFPYKNLTLEHLVIVAEMDERLELLDYAEKNDIKYTEFCDYILNYINCYNNEHGRTYEWVFSAYVGVTKTKKFEKYSKLIKYAKQRESRRYYKTSRDIKRISTKENG